MAFYTFRKYFYVYILMKLNGLATVFALHMRTRANWEIKVGMPKAT